MRVDWRPFAVATGLGVVSAVLGVAPGDAVLVGLVCLVLGLVWVTLAHGETHPWPEARLEEKDGTRLDVASLTWAFLGRDGRVSEAAVRRLREVAARRLLDHGAHVTGALGRTGSTWQGDGDDVQRARELLGERAWRSLTAPGGMMPTVADVAHCLDVVEALGAVDRRGVRDPLDPHLPRAAVGGRRPRTPEPDRPAPARTPDGRSAT